MPSLAKVSTVIFILSYSYCFAEYDDFTIVKVHLDQVQRPKNILEGASDCLRNSVCKAAADATAAYFGLDSKLVTSGLALVSGGKAPGSEEAFLTYKLPQGYQYCHSKVDLISIVPKSGKRDSVLGVTANSDNVSVYTWTGKQPVGGGNSWVEADFTIVGVKDALGNEYRNNGKCKPNTTRVIVDCRGGGSHGKPVCQSVSD